MPGLTLRPGFVFEGDSFMRFGKEYSHDRQGKPAGHHLKPWMKEHGEVKKHVESLLSIMKTAIVRDHALLISGFGKFEAYAKEARKGRNPATSEAITLDPRKVVVFRLSKKFRAALN